MSNFIANRKIIFEDRVPPWFDRKPNIRLDIKIKFTKTQLIIKAIINFNVTFNKFKKIHTEINQAKRKFENIS